MNAEIVDEVIAAAGSQEKLAAKLSEFTGKTITRGVVMQWKARGKIPPEHCRASEIVIGGKVTRYRMRPDVFGTSHDDARPFRAKATKR